MSLKTRISYFSIAAVLASCVNPTVSVKPDIDQFKKEYSDHIQTFKGRKRTLQYAWSGDPSKRAILFVHGSPGSWEGWAHFLRAPQLQKDFQVFAVDRPGFGGSGAGTSEPSLIQQASDVMEVLRFNKSHLPAILVGHSYGGPVIVRAAMDFPEQIGGLVIVAGSVSPDLEKTMWFQYPATWWPFRVLIPTDLRMANEEIMPLKDELTAMLPLWKNIKAKTAIVQGDKDDLVPPANADFVLAHLNPGTVVKVNRITDLNHFVPWKRPELIMDGIQVVNDAISNF